MSTPLSLFSLNHPDFCPLLPHRHCSQRPPVLLNCKIHRALHSLPLGPLQPLALQPTPSWKLSSQFLGHNTPWFSHLAGHSCLLSSTQSLSRLQSSNPLFPAESCACSPQSAVTRVTGIENTSPAHKSLHSANGLEGCLGLSAGLSVSVPYIIWHLQVQLTDQGPNASPTMSDTGLGADGIP